MPNGKGRILVHLYHSISLFPVHTSSSSFCFILVFSNGQGWVGTPIYKLWVCAMVKGIVFKQFSLGLGMKIRELIWCRTGNHLLGNLSKFSLE